MAIERHLILQELMLRPSSEWTPSERGWVVARVAEGVGYWLPGGSARELNVGDGFVVGFNANTVVRASQLGTLKLQFFTVQPQYLSGLLTMAEWHQLESASENPLTRVTFFTASEPLGQKFARIAAQTSTDGLTMRCALLQLWTGAVANIIGPLSTSAGSNKLRERFRQLVGQMPEARLSECSLSALSAQLHCSQRHFSRLFREEFGVTFRARQAELRLQHARQLLASSDAKIINIAYDSGYRHLGLFNSMFKKRFGATPSEWRQQNLKKENGGRGGNCSRRSARAKGVLSAVIGLFFALGAGPLAGAAPPDDSQNLTSARTALMEKMNELDVQEKKAVVHVVPISTNGPHFAVDKYLVAGNSILPPGAIGGVLTDVPAAFGTNVTFDAIRAALADLQMSYREHGYVTVSVSLPQQKLTNAMVKVKVTEGRLAAINVTGNEYFSSNNVMRALPSLHTNMLLNTHVFQRELDVANASRDRQIYPVIGPGPEPDTSELTLKVKDSLPLHMRLEVNNQATPNTPDLRANFSAQYDNLWDLEHQIGLQYNFSFNDYKVGNEYVVSPLDDPLIANYSAYYRLPIGGYRSVEQQVEASPGSFGYSEVTHKFNLPANTSRPELTFYASRSTSDTAVQRGPSGVLYVETNYDSSVGNYNALTITTNSAGQNITLNENIGFKLSMPLPQMGRIASTLALGADFKHYQQTSYNTNENNLFIQIPDSGAPGGGGFDTISYEDPQNLPVNRTALKYFPLNVGVSGSAPDPWGTTFFNALVNFNVFPLSSETTVQTTTTNITTTATNYTHSSETIHGHSLAGLAYSANAPSQYVTVQAGVDRVQMIYKDWSVKLHADGQWANGALFSNEQYALGGSTSVRGYTDGEFYGDTGWRVSIEPQTPMVNIGMVDGDVPFWIRSSVFMDYGEAYLLEKTSPGAVDRACLWGVGWNLMANIGNHLDARLTIAYPLMATTLTSVGDVHIYFGVGAQF